MESAFALAQAEYKAAVLQDAWGHLRPRPRQKYSGWMILAYSAYGGLLIIDSAWQGLNDSPWLYDAMEGYLCEQELEPGSVVRFEGTVMWFKNGRSSFAGSRTRLV